MKRVIQEYGSMAVAVIGCIAAITLLVAGIYTGTSATKTRGILSALGKEAVFSEQYTTSVRPGLIEEDDRADILLQCQQALAAGQEIDINEIFSAEGENKNYPVKIQHIYNCGGEDVLRKKDVFYEGNRLCIGEAGWYNICVMVRAEKSIWKVFKIYVI